MTDRLISWQPRNTASSAQPKVTRNANCYPNSRTRRWSPYYQRVMRLTNHHVAGTKRQFKPNTSPHYLTVKTETQQLGDTHMTCGMTWKIEQVRPDRSMDRGGVPRCAMMATRLDVTNITTSGPKTADELHPRYITTWPNKEAPQTPFASLTK